MTRTWAGPVPRIILILALLAATVGGLLLTNAGAAQQEEAPTSAALSWLRDQQLSNGGFPGFSGEADLRASADATLAFAVSGVNPITVTTEDGASVVDYLVSQLGQLEGRTGVAAKVVLALHASGTDTSAAVPFVVDGYDGAAGQYGASLFEHAIAVLALSAVGETIDPSTLDRIEDAQAPNGGWGFNGEGNDATTDSNTTALVIQALVGADVAPDAVEAGVEYLLSTQASDGSFAYDLTEEPLVGDANSTALAIQALLAGGLDPSDEPVDRALDALVSFQNPSGAFHWRPDFGTDDNLLATVQAVPALELQPLPIEPVMSEPASDSLEEALAPADPRTGCTYHDATAHNVCAPFDAYWSEHGGLEIFGYPISEPFEEDGATVQYFERARMEWQPGAWPDNDDILLGRLGAELVELLTSE